MAFLGKVSHINQLSRVARALKGALIAGFALAMLSGSAWAQAPAAPTTAPDLVAGFDTGVLDTDNITNSTTLRFQANCPTGTAGGSVQFIIDGTVADTQSCVTVGDLATSVQITNVMEGNRLVTVRAVNSASQTSTDSPALTVTVDTTRPTVQSFTGTRNVVGDAPFTGTVTYSEPVWFLSLANAGVGTPVATSSDGEVRDATAQGGSTIAGNLYADTYTVTIDPYASRVNSTIDAEAQNGGQDVAGNFGAIAGRLTQSFPVNGPADTTPPVVQSIALVGSPADNSASVQYDVTFDENVQNVSTDDFEVIGTGGVTGSVSHIFAQTADTVFRVTVSSILGNGTMRLRLKDNTNITDTSGNGNNTNGYVTNFQSSARNVNVSADTTPPVVQSISVAGSPYANAESVTFNVTFDEAVQNLSTSAVELVTTGTATGSVQIPSFVSGTTHAFPVTGISGAGTIGLNVIANSTITDTNGNGNGTNGTVAAFTGQTHTVAQADLKVVTQGTSGGNIDVSPERTSGGAAYDFGNQTQNVNSASHRFGFGNVVTNTYLTIQNFAISGTHASDFVLSPNPTQNGSYGMVGGLSSEVAVRFKPSGLGTRTAALTITSTDPDEGSFVINLTGTGVAGNMVIIQGDNQSSVVNNTTAPSHGVRVTDAQGNPLQNVAVTFTAPSSGASANMRHIGLPNAQPTNPYTAVTDAQGEIRVLSFANGVAGTYQITASTASANDVVFTRTNTAGNAAALAVVSGSGQSAQLNAAFGAPLVAKVTDANGNPKSGVTVTFAANAGGNGQSASLSAPSAVTDANGEASVTATANGSEGAFTVTASTPGLTDVTFNLTNNAGPSVEETRREIASFLQNRSSHILNNRPSLIGRINGRSNSGGGALGYLAINGNEGGKNVFFSTSRSKILAARDGTSSQGSQLISETAQSRIDAAFGEPTANAPSGGDTNAASMSSASQDMLNERLLGFAPVSDGEASDDPSTTTLAFDGSATAIEESRAGTWDIWTEIYGSRSNAGASTSSLWVGYLGMHYFLDDRNVIGVLGQLDWADETNSAANSSADGMGWMIGPYIAGQFKDQNLFYEAQLSYGRSDNTISPIGTYRDSFDTTRLMASGKLSGEYKHGDMTIRPEVGITWYEETQESYTDSLANLIPETTVTLGEIRFGPSFEQSMTLDDGTQFTPSFGITGVYNFDLSGNNASQATAIGTEELRARLSAGFVATNPDSGISFALEGFYDGIGIDNYETYGGRARITVPLN